MAGLAAFVSELVRAANEVSKLSDFEKRRLLDRAYTTIRDGRDEVGMVQNSVDLDPAIDFLTMSRSATIFTDEEMKSALLEAADMIRTLKIVLDAKAEVLAKPPKS